MVSIHLIRHAHAGDRFQWDQDDELRPLTAKGQAQAQRLSTNLAGSGIDLLWSSRYLRCRETLEPLAQQLGLPVIEHESLCEGQYGPPALDALLNAVSSGHTVAACSHGDVIPEILLTARRRGAELVGPEVPRKAARYELTVSNGMVTTIHHVARPEV